MTHDDAGELVASLPRAHFFQLLNDEDVIPSDVGDPLRTVRVRGMLRGVRQGEPMVADDADLPRAVALLAEAVDALACLLADLGGDATVRIAMAEDAGRLAREALALAGRGPEITGRDPFPTEPVDEEYQSLAYGPESDQRGESSCPTN